MLNTLLLTVILIVITLLANKFRDNFDMWSGWSIGSFIVVLILWAFSLISILTMKLTFDTWISERNSFELTLHNARSSGNTLEAASIVRDVANWNKELAKNKLYQEHWLLHSYIDDRIDNLKPIQ
jgi:hypothetical protein